MFFLYLNPLFASFLLSIFLTWALIKISERFRLFSNLSSVDSSGRIRNICRLGGVAIIASFILVVISDSHLVLTNHLAGFLASAVLILIVGVVDDFLNLGPGKQLFFQFLTSMAIVLSGIRIDYLANPFWGSAIRLDGNELFGFPALGSVFIILWLIFLMNVLNWVDGLDGLAGGIGAIGAVSLFFLSISPVVNQPPLGIISIAFLGSLLGFLLFNFHPAKIFMGTSGAMFVGFALGVISIFSGAKLATLVMVLSVPILDALWVIIQRMRNKKSVFRGDRLHLHYRLLTLGFSERQVIVFYYIIAAVFGFIAFNTGGLGKIITFVLFSVTMMGILIGISLLPERHLGRERTKGK